MACLYAWHCQLLYCSLHRHRRRIQRRYWQCGPRLSTSLSTVFCSLSSCLHIQTLHIVNTIPTVIDYTSGPTGSHRLVQPAEHTHTLRLGERIGSGGRSAVVNAAEVPKLKNDADTHPHPPKERLCVKIARPNRCRTLAREVRACEQLRWRGRLQGVSAPRYHGFCTSSVERTGSLIWCI